MIPNQVSTDRTSLAVTFSVFSSLFPSYLYLWRDTPLSVRAEYLMIQNKQQCHSFKGKQQALGPAMHTEMYSHSALRSSIFPRLAPPLSLALTPNEVYWIVHVICPLLWPVLSEMASSALCRWMLTCLTLPWARMKKNIPGILPFCPGSPSGNLRQ